MTGPHFFLHFFQLSSMQGVRSCYLLIFFGVIAIVDQTIELRMPCEILE